MFLTIDIDLVKILAIVLTQRYRRRLFTYCRLFTLLNDSNNLLTVKQVLSFFFAQILMNN